MTYQHNTFDPNLNNLHHSMEYAPDGKPHIRVTLGSDTININGDVLIPTPLPVTDNDGSLTVDGIVSISGPVGITGPISVTGPVSVTGTVNIASMPEVEIKNDVGNPIPVSWVYGNGSSLIPWEVQVSRGKITGVSNLNISGYNTNVGNVWTPVWHNTIAYTYPVSASTMRIWSDNASDTDINVTIFGLDANYVAINETVTLTNGTTGVLTNSQFLRINNMSINRTPMNLGVIYCGNSAKTAYYCAIEIGAGRSQQTIYTVPAGYTFYLTQSNWYTNNTGQNVGDYRSWTQSPTGVINIILIFPFPVNYTSRKTAPRAYPEKTDIQWQVQSKSGTIEVGGQIEGYLISNSLS